MEYWELRREEVFCLKFLCVEAVTINNDTHLINFCHRMMECTKWAFWYRSYNRLIDDIQLILSKIKKDKDYCFESGSAVVEYSKEIKELKGQLEAMELDLEKSKLEVRKKSEQIESLCEERARSLSMIESMKSEMQEQRRHDIEQIELMKREIEETEKRMQQFFAKKIESIRSEYEPQLQAFRDTISHLEKEREHFDKKDEKSDQKNDEATKTEKKEEKTRRLSGDSYRFHGSTSQKPKNLEPTESINTDKISTPTL